MSTRKKNVGTLITCSNYSIIESSTSFLRKIPSKTADIITRIPVVSYQLYVKLRS